MEHGPTTPIASQWVFHKPLSSPSLSSSPWSPISALHPPAVGILSLYPASLDIWVCISTAAPRFPVAHLGRLCRKVPETKSPCALRLRIHIAGLLSAIRVSYLEAVDKVPSQPWQPLHLLHPLGVLRGAGSDCQLWEKENL